MKKIILLALIVSIVGCSRQKGIEPLGLELASEQAQVAERKGLLDGKWQLNRGTEGSTELIINTQEEKMLVHETLLEARPGIKVETTYVNNFVKIENTQEDVLKKGQVGAEVEGVYLKVTGDRTVSSKDVVALSHHLFDTITANQLSEREYKKYIRIKGREACWRIDDPQLLAIINQANVKKNDLIEQSYTIYPNNDHIIEEEMIKQGEKITGFYFERVTVTPKKPTKGS